MTISKRYKWSYQKDLAQNKPVDKDGMGMSPNGERLLQSIVQRTVSAAILQPPFTIIATDEAVKLWRTK
jgi:predicted metalloendopeptidase